MVPNKYPAFPGHEVVVHGPRHVTSLGDLPPAVMETVMEAWRSRRAALLAGGAGYVLASVNEGAAAGASLDHSHSQLVPFPDPPPRIVQEAGGVPGRLPAVPAAGSDRARAGGPGRLLPAVRARAVRDLDRAHRPPAHTRRWTRPRAAHWPMRSTRLRAVLGADLAWNALLHEGAPGDETFHWHIELWPRLTVAASIELGAGIWVNVVDPAAAAGELMAAVG